MYLVLLLSTGQIKKKKETLEPWQLQRKSATGLMKIQRTGSKCPRKIFLNHCKQTECFSTLRETESTHTQTQSSFLFFFHFEAVPKLFLSVFSTVKSQRGHAVLGIHLCWKTSCHKPFRKYFLWAVFTNLISLLLKFTKKDR